MSAAEPPPAPRKRERELIAAAIEVFWEKGYPAASVADVGERVGMLKGSLYYYIDSKEDLLMRIFQESYDEASAIAAECGALDGPAIARLRAFVERYVAWYLGNVEQISLYFSEWRHLTGERHALVKTQRAEFEVFVRELIEAAQAEGDVPPDVDAPTTTFFVLGAMNSVATWYRPDGPMAGDEVAARYAQLLLGGMTADEGIKRSFDRFSS